ncbi:hypothetical protein WR25_19073 [Diploscapter pachys]|uniref:Uncharacterized protein n=1 Tax=Diploscapter pachys TaxID=2018661 RepID=A0A2A2JCJ0_9BILA|nr:hypothetical protein WR25_19073 [Diploscapter pachys]
MARDFAFSSVDVQFWKRENQANQPNMSPVEERERIDRRRQEIPPSQQYNVRQASTASLANSVPSSSSRPPPPPYGASPQTSPSSTVVHRRVIRSARRIVQSVVYTPTIPEHRHEQRMLEEERYVPSRSGSMDNNVNRRVEMNPAYQKERVTTKEMYRHTLERSENLHASSRSLPANAAGTVFPPQRTVYYQNGGTLPRESGTSRLASTEVRTTQTREIPPTQPAMQQYHTTTGSIESRLDDISGGSTIPQPRAPPGREWSQPLLTYQYKVGSSERRLEYRYHSESRIDDDEIRKRHEIEQWTHTQPVQVLRLDQKEREVHMLQGMSK